MLHEFLTTNRDTLIERCRASVALRAAPKATPVELEFGIPIFLDQLIKTLHAEQLPERGVSRRVSGAAGGGSASEMGKTAGLHGAELLEHGFSIDQVVHDYGDLCQSVMDLAGEKSVPIEVDEFRTLNRSLDNAIADAVAQYSAARDNRDTDSDARLENERAGMFAHELRNLIHTATMAFAAIKMGKVGATGATAAILDRSLARLRDVVDDSIVEVRAKSKSTSRGPQSLAGFITEVKLAVALEAQTRGCRFTVSDVDLALAMDVDRAALLSAVENLLQNAFKFSPRHSEIMLDAYAAGDRIRIEVRDRCGGLPRGAAENMFQPFTQASKDRSGLGLGLSIAKRGVEANGGTIGVRDIPGYGCVFTIELPRHALPGTAEAMSA